MPKASDEEDFEHPIIVAHFHYVGKIALYTGLFTAICMVCVVYYLAGAGGETYPEIFSTYIFTKKQLGPVLLLSGLILVALTAIVTWIFVVYSTYRVAGPLYQFSINLENQIKNGPSPVRKRHLGSHLSEEHLRFSGGASRLQLHYDTLSEWVDLTMVQLELPDANVGGGLAQTVKQLQGVEKLVKL